MVSLKMNISKIMALVAICLFVPIMAIAERKGPVAVLPFRVYTPEPMDHLKKGLQEMLGTRLAGRGLNLISPEVINRHPLASLPVPEEKDIQALGRDLGADWVIMGSLTQIGRKISLDLKVFDITMKRPPFSIFMVEDDVDRLSEATERVSASVYNQIIGIVQIDAIEVKGNKRIENEAILAMVSSKKGDGLDPEQLNKDLRAIYGMGFFKDVTIETADGPKGKIVIFNVSEKPSISKIVFEGNEEEKDKKLEEEAGIKLYSILNRGAIKQSISRLKEFYRQKGYYNVEIKDRIEELPQNEVSLIYEINEGEKVYIRKIEFVGNTKFDDDDIKDIMETSEKGFFSWFTKSGLLEEKKLEFDAQKITSFYHNHGYIKAKVGEPKVSYEKESGLTITIEIVEGPQYGVNEVKVDGDLIRPVDELLSVVKISKEKFFNREVVRKDTLALREIYADDGFAYAEIAPVTREDDEKHVVDITYRISKGERVRFERINITGNTVTRDKVIRRELAVIEGEYFSGQALKKSTSNLYRLGYFGDVQVQTKKGSQEDLMVLDIKVEEKPTGSFSIGAGYSTFETVIFSFQISQNNLFGRGQKLAATGAIGGRTQNFDIRFTEPWTFERPISTTFDIYKWDREWDEYTQDSYGGGVGIGFPLMRLGLDEFTRGKIKYDYDNSDISDVQPGAAEAIQLMEGKNVTSSITLEIARDSRDRFFMPTKGSENSFTFQNAGGFLGGTVGFEKYLADTQWYFPLPWSTVFTARGRGGLIHQKTGEDLPVYQKFRIGGINTVRGFDTFSISPKDPDTGDPIGGEKMMIFNLEYIFPIIKEQGISAVVFFDAGNAWADADPKAWSFSDLRTSAGGGIRWYSPVGPLRIEYGVNLDPQEGESSGEWAFSLGGMF